MGGEHHDLEIAQRVRDLEERLVVAGLIDGDQIDSALTQYMSSKGSVTNGARLVARAWVDEQFRTRLLEDASSACDELGLEWSGERPVFRVVANDQKTHNVVVCTLCSCYPTGLLGPSPYWYRSSEYRARAVREPRVVLEEFGFTVPSDVQVNVWDASADARYMVLPERPSGTDELTEEELVGLVSVRGLIGTASV